MPSKRVIVVSGLTSAGKTTHSHILSGQFDLRYVSTSQLLLFELRRKSFQPANYWLENGALDLWSTPESKLVDTEMMQIEQSEKDVIFDSLAMPWLHRSEALCIWLESSLESRVMKAIVSHRSNPKGSADEISSLIHKKDESAGSKLKDRYGIDLFRDRSPFDVILDITPFILEPTWEAALSSISRSHSLIEPIVGWHLTRKSRYGRQFQDASADLPSGVLIRLPQEFADKWNR